MAKKITKNKIGPKRSRVIPCPICQNVACDPYFQNAKHFFLRCPHCITVFRHPENYLTATAEKLRYEKHQNNVEDPGYQRFVAPLVEAVITSFSCNENGLDYGAGKGPVAAKLLEARGYSISLYDPFFHPDIKVLTNTYDFIICCEVIEHFHHPMLEFKRLLSLLKPNGKLFCMTDFLPDELHQFASWHYKNDPTHVVFYSEENSRQIQQRIGFKDVRIDLRLMILSGP